MADKRITELNELTTLVDADEFLVSDTSASETKKISVPNFRTGIAYTATLPMFPVSHIFHVSAAASGTGYTFQYYNSDGTDQAEPDLKLWADQTYAFYLAYNSSSHPFQIVTGGSDGSAGTVLANNNGARGLIHVTTSGTVTTGTTANTKYSGWLIWKVPHFSANSTGTYGYQCSSHTNMYGDISLYVVG